MANVFETGGGSANIGGNRPYNTGSRVFKNYGNEITQGYSGSHPAVDLVSGGGADGIIAHSAGVVTFAQSGYGNLQGSSGNESYGNCVKIQHDNGYSTLYAHMAYITVGYGARVVEGQIIGRMGNTGNSYGAHLHFEVRNKRDTRINPTRYLNDDLPELSGGGSSGSSGSSGGSEKGGGGAEREPKKPRLPITDAVVKSVSGDRGVRKGNSLGDTKLQKGGWEVLIQNGNRVLSPVLLGESTLTLCRKDSPGELVFTCLWEKGFSMLEGNPVCLRVEGKGVFLGYIFEKIRENPQSVRVVCYDQLRYLKNKTSLSYEGKTYSALLKELASEYGLATGTIEDTGAVLGKRLEEGTLFDILENAGDETLTKNGKRFVLYDDFGALSLKSLSSLVLPILIDQDTAEGYSYRSGIDRDVYTRVQLAADNRETGERELTVANNQRAQEEWGVLQYYRRSEATGAALKEEAKAILARQGIIRRSLEIRNCFGDIRVRGGSSLGVKLGLEDVELRHYMVVERVCHRFQEGVHTMNLWVSGIGGEFVG